MVTCLRSQLFQIKYSHTTLTFGAIVPRLTNGNLRYLKKNVESEEYATYGKSYEMNRINTNEGQPSSATCRMSIPLFVIVICTLIMFYKRQPIRELADTDFASVQNFVKLGLYLKK